MNRLRLIWFALVAPKAAIEKRLDEVQSGWNWAILNDYRKELDELKPNTWKLVGISVEHDGNANIDAIEQFFKRAPNIMRWMIDHSNRDDDTVWKYR